jgi:hypothetical protein
MKNPVKDQLNMWMTWRIGKVNSKTGDFTGSYSNKVMA